MPFSQLDFTHTSGGYVVYTTLVEDTLTTAVYPNCRCGLGDSPQTELSFRVCPVFEDDEEDSQDLQQGARYTMPGQDPETASIEIPLYGPCGSGAPWIIKLKVPIEGLQAVQSGGCSGPAQPLPDVESFEDCACSHPASSGAGCSTALKEYTLGDRKLKGIYVLVTNRAEKDNPGSTACCR